MLSYVVKGTLNVIKSRILRWEDYRELFGLMHVIKRVLIRRRQEDQNWRGESGTWKQRSERRENTLLAVKLEQGAMS